MLGCVLSLACGTGVAVDDLSDLSPADTTCRELPLQTSARRLGVVRSFAIMRQSAAMRSVAVGVDSLDRPRMFYTMTSTKRGAKMEMQIVNVVFDSSGRMSMPVRTFMTRDIATGTGESKSVPLSAVDTRRVRALTTEVLHRCVR
jgi:hypothetical protein